MSDAQKLEGGATDALRAAAAREFGYRRGGVSLLSWVSDMYAIYGQKIVTLAGRESTYTLDEIVHNPILEIERHTTDTYGSTDLLVALFDLIGKTFHPRIRDLQSHVDYRLGPGQPELQVDQLLLRKRAARPGGRYRFHRRGPADGRLRRLRPANINRLHGRRSRQRDTKQSRTRRRLT